MGDGSGIRDSSCGLCAEIPAQCDTWLDWLSLSSLPNRRKEGKPDDNIW